MSVESLAGVNDIIGPSAGALLRRRVFGHAGFMIGLVVILAILAGGAAGAAARALRPL